MNWRNLMQRYCGKQAVIALFLLCALPVTVFTALITPPTQSPDERLHYARVLGLLHGGVLAVRHPVYDPLTKKMAWQSGVKLDASLLAATFNAYTEMDFRPVETLDDWNGLESLRQDPNFVYIDMPNTGSYFPAAYVPATMGAAVALAFGASPLHCFITARLFSAAAFLAVGVAALAIAAYAEALLVTVLLLPMTVFLAGTMNQDGVLLAMTCLAVACLTRATRPWRIAGLVVFALVLGAKPPYLLLLGVFTLPLFAPGFWRRLADMALASLPVLGWIALISLFVVVPYGKLPYLPGPLYSGDHGVTLDAANAGLQMHVLLDRPQRFLALPYYSTIKYLYTDYITGIGVLGPLQIILDPGIYTGWAAALVCAVLGLLVTRRPEAVAPRTALFNFLAVMGAIGVTYWLLNIIFYLDWTNVGMPDIDGIQGRYLLVFLPFLAFAIPHLQSLPGLSRVRFSLPPLLPALPAFGMAVFDIGYIPLKLTLNYYLH